MKKVILLSVLTLATLAAEQTASAEGGPVSPYFAAASEETRARMRVRDAFRRDPSSVCEDGWPDGELLSDSYLYKQKCQFTFRDGDKRKLVRFTIVVLHRRKVQDFCSCPFLQRYSDRDNYEI